MAQTAFLPRGQGDSSLNFYFEVSCKIKQLLLGRHCCHPSFSISFYLYHLTSFYVFSRSFGVSFVFLVITIEFTGVFPDVKIDTLP